MSALSVLIALFIGGAVGGFFGLLLAVPLWACGKILVEEYVLPRLLDDAERA
jgi:predicted PurR-regulated permease PerM